MLRKELCINIPINFWIHCHIHWFLHFWRMLFSRYLDFSHRATGTSELQLQPWKADNLLTVCFRYKFRYKLRIYCWGECLGLNPWSLDLESNAWPLNYIPVFHIIYKVYNCSNTVDIIVTYDYRRNKYNFVIFSSRKFWKG